MHRGLALALVAASLLRAQDDTKPVNAPEVEPSSGDVRVWRAQSKQAEKATTKFRVEAAASSCASSWR